MALIQPELAAGLNELFFAPIVVIVEGQEDQAFIVSHAVAHGYWEEMRRWGVAIVLANGKGHMARPLAIGQDLSLRIFTIFDADCNVVGSAHEGVNRNDNIQLLKLNGLAADQPFPANHLWTSHCVVWKQNLGTAIEADFDPAVWSSASTLAKASVGGIADPEKKPLYIASLIASLADAGHRSNCLDLLCDSVIVFAKGGSE